MVNTFHFLHFVSWNSCEPPTYFNCNSKNTLFVIRMGYTTGIANVYLPPYTTALPNSQNETKYTINPV